MIEKEMEKSSKVSENTKVDDLLSLDEKYCSWGDTVHYAA